ncbi:MAG TPA: ribonuclease III [Nevskiaceae bacterium]|nr:ribonuclease III [Nevskiaceae bacterium]
MKNHQNLEKKLGVKFKNPRLLNQALVHRSYLNEATDKKLVSNERLEFLGDAILSFIVSEWLYQNFPDYHEGTLTNLRSNLVKTETLAKIASKFQVGKYLLLSRGEKESEGQKNPSLLANTLEAIIGAVFLDQGLQITKKLVKKNFKPLLENLIKAGEFKDYKSLLQEKIQAKTKQTPVYKTIKQVGPDHARIFTVGVYSQGKLLAKAIGKSKQEAEGKTAGQALEKLAS